MKEFKSSNFIVLKNIVYGIFGGAFLALIAYWFLPFYIAAAIGCAAFLFMLYCALYGDRIRIVVEDDRFFIYRRKKLKHQFVRREVGLYAKIRTSDGDSDCTLTVEEADGNKTYIDCSLLGASRFYKLLDALDVTDPEPVAVKTTKK